MGSCHDPNCLHCIAWLPWYTPQLTAAVLMLVLFVCFLIAYYKMERDRERERRETWDRLQREMAQPEGAAAEAAVQAEGAAARSPEREGEGARGTHDDAAAAEQELLGRNPHKVTVVASSPDPCDSRTPRIVIKRRKASNTGISRPKSSVKSAVSVVSSSVSCAGLSFMARVTHDSTGHALEIIDLLGSEDIMNVIGEQMQREAIVDGCKGHLQNLTGTLYVVYGLVERGEAICRGAESLMNMKHTHLKLHLTVLKPVKMTLLAHEVEIGEDTERCAMKKESDSRPTSHLKSRAAPHSSRSSTKTRASQATPANQTAHSDPATAQLKESSIEKRQKRSNGLADGLPPLNPVKISKKPSKKSTKSTHTSKISLISNGK